MIRETAAKRTLAVAGRSPPLSCLSNHYGIRNTLIPYGIPTLDTYLLQIPTLDTLAQRPEAVESEEPPHLELSPQWRWPSFVFWEVWYRIFSARPLSALSNCIWLEKVGSLAWIFHFRCLGCFARSTFGTFRFLLAAPSRAVK